MSIVITPIPSTIELAAPAFTLGTTNTAGAAVTAVSSNSTLLTFDATVPTTIAYSATAAPGSASTCSHRDHTHGMFAAGTPVFGRVLRTAGNVTTTSTTLVALTGATITITTGAYPVAYGVVQSGENSGANTQNYNIDIDGALQLGSIGMGVYMVADVNRNLSFAGQSVALSAAQHTIALHWDTTSGTGTTYASTSRSHLFWAHEIRS